MDKHIKKMKESELEINVYQALFGILFDVLLGTAILAVGFCVGALFYAEGVCCAVWLVVSLFKLIKLKKETKESEDEV